MEKLWGAKLEVDLNKIIYNINAIKDFIGSDVDIMPIIKDNGYGTRLNDKIWVLKETGIKIVAVAIVDEGVYLRKNGYDGDIFVLNQPTSQEIPSIIKYNLIAGIGSISFLHELGKYNNNFKIHMEIGTGMGRTGINPKRVSEYLDVASQYSNIIIDGIYTHFSCSDCDEDYTKLQIKSFNYAIEIAKPRLKNLRYIHCCNSAGILNFPNAHFNLVRPGLILYGYYPSEELKRKINLKPAIKFKYKVSFIKKVKPGTSISYSRKFITNRDTVVITIPLGYADGIRRSLSNKGSVVINGMIAPIIGAVCMDCFMVDATDIGNVKVGDDVFIWDNEHITVEDIANIYDTINYEVISTISDRVIREYIY